MRFPRRECSSKKSSTGVSAPVSSWLFVTLPVFSDMFRDAPAAIVEFLPWLLIETQDFLLGEIEDGDTGPFPWEATDVRGKEEETGMIDPDRFSERLDDDLRALKKTAVKHDSRAIRKKKC